MYLIINYSFVCSNYNFKLPKPHNLYVQCPQTRVHNVNGILRDLQVYLFGNFETLLDVIPVNAAVVRFCRVNVQIYLL